MHLRRPLSILAVAAIGLAVSGCAVDEDHDGHDDSSADARVIEIVGDDFAFTPERIEIGAGEEVAIELTAVDLEHDFVIEGMDAHVHADPGETATGQLRIDEAGSYTAHCSVAGHREAGMTATVVVTE